MTVVSSSFDAQTLDVWEQLKLINCEFIAKQIQRRTWDFAVDIARFSVATLQSTSANDLLMQEAFQEFNAKVLKIRDQLILRTR